jgi:antitoxin (DNA-binding transcriptional repressor) of toxin-antitoxin stability system
LIARLVPGEELVITRDNEPVARLIGESADAGEPRQPGSARGKLIIHSEDDEHLRDFQDYLP